ncbi:9606_t:CDS:2, partial [Acaulospora morrowiae]
MNEQYNDQESDIGTLIDKEDVWMNSNQINEAITGAKRIEARKYYRMTTKKETKTTFLEGTITELIKQMQELAANYTKLITMMTFQAGPRMRNR